MRYLRQIHKNPMSELTGKWAKVKAASHKEAVLKGLRPARLGTGTYYFWIAQDIPENKHENGRPYCVHRFQVEIGV